MEITSPHRTECPLCGCVAALHFSLAHTHVWRCLARECGLQFARPQLDRADLARAYTNLYYPAAENGDPTRLENTSDSILRQVFRQLEAQLGSLAGLRLLDYGCGRGTLLSVAIDLGMRPTGIESDPYARLAAARVNGALTYA